MLKIHNLFKSYKTKQVLKGINMNVPKGEITALVGVNGAGKSTLVDIVCGVKPYNSGEIFVDEKNIASKKNQKEIKYVLGYMPQQFGMFNDLTVSENLEYLCTIYKIDKNIIENIINKCHLTQFKNSLAKNLSGGYRQLLSLACAIIHNPKFLILDEPTSAMDPVFRKSFWDIVKDINKNGATILTITHHLEEVEECDNIICLASGKILFSGEIKDFYKNGILDKEKILKIYDTGVKNE